MVLEDDYLKKDARPTTRDMVPIYPQELYERPSVGA
jgi:hypothetical protein